LAHRLEGNWREDVLFELQQVVKAYDFHQQQMGECDQQLEKYMKAQPARMVEEEVEALVAPAQASSKPGRKKKRRKPPKNQPGFGLQEELKRVMGVDLSVIDGIKLMTIQTIYSELGSDLSAFPSEGSFTSWLMLAPRRDVSGGKVIRHHSLHGRNRVANALRMAAESLNDSDSYLGARYRSLRGRLGGLKAVKAMARYLACLVYRMLTKGQAWVDRGAAWYEEKRRDRELVHLQKKAAALGWQLLPKQ